MVYICIPVHDEEQTIGVLLWKIRRVMAEFGRDYEVLVLNDASTDDTAEVLKRYARVVPLQVLEEKERIGYTAAVERLLHEAVERAPYPKRDAVVTMQGDFTESPDHIVPLVKAIEGGADIVAGSLETGDAHLPRTVRLTRWAAHVALRRVFREAPVSDPLCGFRAYRVIVLKKALRTGDDRVELQRDHWSANLEMLGMLAPHARRIDETRLEMRYDLLTRETRFRAFPTLKSLFRLRRLTWPAETEERA